VRIQAFIFGFFRFKLKISMLQKQDVSMAQALEGYANRRSGGCGFKRKLSSGRLSSGRLGASQPIETQ
jgi:hypothetical protein